MPSSLASALAALPPSTTNKPNKNNGATPRSNNDKGSNNNKTDNNKKEEIRSVNKEREEQRRERERLKEKLDAENDAGKIKDTAIRTMKQEIDRLTTELKSEKDLNDENVANILAHTQNLKVAQSDLRATVDEQDGQLESLKEELAREKTAYAGKVLAMKAVIEKQTNSCNATTASGQIEVEHLRGELERARELGSEVTRVHEAEVKALNEELESTRALL